MVHNPGGDDCILSGGVDPTYTFTHENPLLPKVQQELHGLCGTLTSSSGCFSGLFSVFLRVAGHGWKSQITMGIKNWSSLDGKCHGNLRYPPQSYPPQEIRP